MTAHIASSTLLPDFEEHVQDGEHPQERGSHVRTETLEMMRSMGGGEGSTSRTGDAKSQTGGGSDAANKQPGPDKPSFKDATPLLNELAKHIEPPTDANASRTPVKTRTEEIEVDASATHSSHAAAGAPQPRDANPDSSASKPAETRVDRLPSNPKDTLTYTRMLPPPSLTPADPMSSSKPPGQ